MTSDLAGQICTRCGLCCDGTLFADVELSGWSEAIQLEVLGVSIEDDNGAGDRALLRQPCTALDGTRCRIYTNRPRCCRTFECGVLQDAQRGTIAVEVAQREVAEALRRSRRMKTLLAQLGSRDTELPLLERYANALARPAGDDPGVAAKRAELETEKYALGKLIWKRFLGRRWG